MKHNGVSYVEHYLDDFITCASSKEQCLINLNIMLQMCEKIGFKVNPGKLVQPTTLTQFLGIIIDSIKMETRISHDRLSDITQELLEFIGRSWCKKRQILSLIGKLEFISRVVKPGRTFIRRMIDMSKRAKHLHYRIKLTRQFQEDVKWWLFFLPSWNGVSIMAEDVWNSSNKLQLFTDASDQAVSAYLNGQWCILPLTHEFIYIRTSSINFRELYAIVMALCTWATTLAGTKLLLYCDNLAICYVINSGVSKNPNIMKLIRFMFYICALHSIECRAVHLSTNDNGIADSLSRFDFVRLSC
jgi:hypothetical protein